MSRKRLAPLNVPALAADPATPTLRAGDLYYNTGTAKVRAYSGAAWADISTGGGTPATTVQTESGLDAGQVGTSTNYAREDHRHPISGLMDLASSQVVANSKTWNAVQYMQAGAGTGPVNGAPPGTTPGLALWNSTASTAGTQQNAPGYLLFQGTYWNGAASTGWSAQIDAYVYQASGTTRLRYTATDHYFQGIVETTGNLFENGNRVYSAGNAPPYPVTSVAGRTGAVALTAADVAAGTFPGANTFSQAQTFSGGIVAATSYGVNSGNAGLQLSNLNAATSTNVVQAPGTLRMTAQYWTGSFSAQAYAEISATITNPAGSTALNYTASAHTFWGTVNTTGNLSENGNRVYSSANPPPYPVTSVAGRAGAVTLTAADVGAGTFPGANTFSQAQTVTASATTSVSYGGYAGVGAGLSLANASAATAGALVQLPGALAFSGNYWTGAASAGWSATISATVLGTTGNTEMRYTAANNNFTGVVAASNVKATTQVSAALTAASTTYGRPGGNSTAVYLDASATAATATNLQQLPGAISFGINYWTGAASALAIAQIYSYVTSAAGATELNLAANSLATSGTLSTTASVSGQALNTLNFNPAIRLRNTTAATSGTQLQLPGALEFDMNYWNGAASVAASVYVAASVANATGRTVLQFNADQFYLQGDVNASASVQAGTYLQAWGLPGATAGTGRYVGVTTSGAPVGNPFNKGDWVTTENGHIWICTVAGTPGTWVDAGTYGGGAGTPATTVQTESGLDVGQVGTSTNYAREDHRHPITNLVDLSSVQTISGLKTLQTNFATTFGNTGSDGLALQSSTAADGTNTVTAAGRIVWRSQYWNGVASALSGPSYIAHTIFSTGGAARLVYSSSDHAFLGTMSVSGLLTPSAGVAVPTGQPLTLAGRNVVRTTKTTSTANATVTAAHNDVWIVNAIGVTVNLPAAAADLCVTVKLVGNPIVIPTDWCTIAPPSGTIDGAASWKLTEQYQSIEAWCDGTNWWII